MTLYSLDGEIDSDLSHKEAIAKQYTEKNGKQSSLKRYFDDEYYYRAHKMKVRGEFDISDDRIEGWLQYFHADEGIDVQLKGLTTRTKHFLSFIPLFNKIVRSKNRIHLISPYHSSRYAAFDVVKTTDDLGLVGSYTGYWFDLEQRIVHDKYVEKLFIDKPKKCFAELARNKHRSRGYVNFDLTMNQY